MLSSIKLPRTAPLLISDNRNSSFGQHVQQIKKLHTTNVYRNIRMIASAWILVSSKIATIYREIGSRREHRRTGIDDQTSD
jgi:hypothetical protein